jgi:SAM-dependent methyltransferase
MPPRTTNPGKTGVVRQPLRRIYREWHELVAARLADVPGATIELGAGIGRFKEVVPDAVATDIQPTPWADAVVDAGELPYEDGSVANLVLIDVFHHLARPARFLDEAVRVLAPAGRVVLLEPSAPRCRHSPTSTSIMRTSILLRLLSTTSLSSNRL